MTGEELLNHGQDQEGMEEALANSNPIISSSALLGQIPQQEREEEITREDTQRN